MIVLQNSQWSNILARIISKQKISAINGTCPLKTRASSSKWGSWNIWNCKSLLFPCLLNLLIILFILKGNLLLKTLFINHLRQYYILTQSCTFQYNHSDINKQLYLVFCIFVYLLLNLYSFRKTIAIDEWINK